MEKMKETFRRLRFGSDPSYEKQITSMIDLSTSSSSETQKNRLNNNDDNEKSLHLDNMTSSKTASSSPNLLSVSGKGYILYYLYQIQFYLQKHYKC